MKKKSISNGRYFSWLQIKVVQKPNIKYKEIKYKHWYNEIKPGYMGMIQNPGT